MWIYGGVSVWKANSAFCFRFPTTAGLLVCFPSHLESLDYMFGGEFREGKCLGKQNHQKKLQTVSERSIFGDGQKPSGHR